MYSHSYHVSNHYCIFTNIKTIQIRVKFQNSSTPATLQTQSTHPRQTHTKTTPFRVTIRQIGTRVRDRTLRAIPGDRQLVHGPTPSTHKGPKGPSSANHGEVELDDSPKWICRCILEPPSSVQNDGKQARLSGSSTVPDFSFRILKYSFEYEINFARPPT